MGMMQNAFANTSSSLLSSKVAGNILDLLMPPFKINEILIVYCMAAIIRASLVGFLTFLMMIPFVNIELLKRKEDYLQFSFDIQIKDLKNFTNLISQIKQSNLKFKIIRHKQKKNAFIRRIFENFKRN